MLSPLPQPAHSAAHLDVKMGDGRLAFSVFFQLWSSADLRRLKSHPFGSVWISVNGGTLQKHGKHTNHVQPPDLAACTDLYDVYEISLALL